MAKCQTILSVKNLLKAKKSIHLQFLHFRPKWQVIEKKSLRINSIQFLHSRLKKKRLSPANPKPLLNTSVDCDLRIEH